MTQQPEPCTIDTIDATALIPICCDVNTQGEVTDFDGLPKASEIDATDIEHYHCWNCETTFPVQTAADPVSVQAAWQAVLDHLDNQKKVI